MSRRVLLLVVAVLGVLVVAGSIALVVSARPDLEDRRDALDARWAALRGPLSVRYQGLDQLRTALTDAGAGERTYTTDLASALADWARLEAATDLDAGAEAAAANRLEGLANRVRANVARSARLGPDPGIAQAFGAFDAALVPPPDVRAYNRAVRAYQDARTATRNRLAADLLGYDPRPVLVLGAPPG